MRYIIILLLFILMSCTTTKYVEVPVDRIKIEYIDKVKYDSVYNYDSIYIKDKGDTVFTTTYKYLYKYKYLRDTINTTDTITKINIVETKKEVNKLYTWQIFLMVMGGGSLGFCLYKLISKMKSWI